MPGLNSGSKSSGARFSPGAIATAAALDITGAAAVAATVLPGPASSKVPPTIRTVLVPAVAPGSAVTAAVAGNTEEVGVFGLSSAGSRAARPVTGTSTGGMPVTPTSGSSPGAPSAPLTIIVMTHFADLFPSSSVP